MMAAQVLSEQVEVFMTTISTPDQTRPRPDGQDRWLGVELRHLAALEAVARTSSFGRAAVELGYTQSAVSQQIAALERIVGEKLVDRPGGPRAVSLTEAGELLLRHAEAIVNRLDAARADMAALQAGETGTLRVATYQSVSARVLPTVMRRFMGSWGGISIELSEPSNDEGLYHGIESGSIDLGFASLPVPDGPFDWTELLSDPHVLVVSADNPLAGRRSASLADLHDVALIGSNMCSSARILESALSERGTPVEYAFRSDDNTTLQGLAAARFGVALMPLLAVQPGDDRVAVLAVDPPVPSRRLGVVWHRDRHRSPAARAFVEIAREVSLEVEQELGRARPDA
jgi:DNA-binding transcriptional LysR family regulator